MSAASVGTAVPTKDGGNTEPSEGNYRQIYLAGGCFWGVQKYMSLIPGIVETETGYANGILENPTYAQVCSGTTGYNPLAIIWQTYKKGLLTAILFCMAETTVLRMSPQNR